MDGKPHVYIRLKLLYSQFTLFWDNNRFRPSTRPARWLPTAHIVRTRVASGPQLAWRYICGRQGVAPRVRRAPRAHAVRKSYGKLVSLL